MSNCATWLSGQAEGVYCTLNPVNPALQARANNRLKPFAKHTTNDSDIVRRRWLPLDFDPRRPAGISSTEEEHRLALDRAKECAEWLSLVGWPEPIAADSGNGAHLLYPIDLPNDGASTDLIKRVLESLALRFSDGLVELDIKTGNAARIWKIYGTLAAKGDSTSDRPHRQARILSRPATQELISHEQLSAIAMAESLAVEPQRGDENIFDLVAWLQEHDIEVSKQKPWNGATCYILKICPNNPEHNHGEAFILQFANGRITAKCQHRNCGLSWESLRQIGAATNLDSPMGGSSGTGAESKGRRSQASRLVDIGSLCELFHTPGGKPYACIAIGDHREIWATNSKAFEENLVRSYYVQTGSIPNSQAVRDAITTLNGFARFDGEEHQVYVRIAGDDDHIWLDLGNASWQAVEITATGWRVRTNAPVRFRRAAGMLSLPVPEPGGSVADLKPFLNISDVHTFSLILSWCVSALRPRGPYPILYLIGEQGSAKSTATKVIRKLIDPFTALLRTMPRNERDLYITANHSQVIVFDNVSRIEAWMSDALCRLATGGGFATRTLFTDDDEILFDATRPIMMNGIEQAAVRGDFLERSLILTLPTIADETRLDETTFWKGYELARPRILGAVLDGLCAALGKYHTTHLPNKPRMADFAIWSTAAETGLGFEAGTFERSYRSNRQAANDIALEAMPISTYILQLVENMGTWRGTSKELLTELNRLRGSISQTKTKGWPETPRKLSADLQRMAPNLRVAGIDYSVSAPGHQRQRTITLSVVVKATSPISPTSPSPESTTSTSKTEGYASSENPGNLTNDDVTVASP